MKKIFGLDLVRFIAIVTVVCVHGHSFIQTYFTDDATFFYDYYDGVGLFFVLSGFLIGSILLKTIDQQQNFKIREILIFWKRRWFRTIPNYYLILIINLLIGYFNFLPLNFEQVSWKYIFFLQFFVTHQYWFFMESWSLAVEEWFYFFTPIFIALYLLFLNPKQSFLFSAVVFIIIGFIARYYQINFSGIGNDYLDINIAHVTLTRIDSIAFGLFAAWVNYFYPTVFLKYRYISFFVGLMLMYILHKGYLYDCPYFKNNLIFPYCTMALMFFLPLMNSIKNAPIIIKIPVEFISKISYSMYLIHILINQLIVHNYPNYFPTNGIFKYVLYWSLIICFSAIIYFFYEKPITNLRDRT